MRQNTSSVAFLLVFATFFNVFIPILGIHRVEAAESENSDFQEIERKELRSENGKVFQTDEYEYRLEESAAKIHYGTPGNYKPVNNNIIVSPSGKYKFRNAANDFTLRAGAFLNDGIYFKGHGKFCEFKLESVDGEVVNNSTGTATGNKLTYPNIFPNADLEITVLSTGILTEIVVKSENALKQNIIYELSNCNNSQFDEPTMTNGNKGAKVNQSTKEENGKKKLVLNPDYSKLGKFRGEVRIDPSLTRASVKDIFVSTATSNGNRRALFIGGYIDYTAPGDPFLANSRALIDFGKLELPAGRTESIKTVSRADYHTRFTFIKIPNLNSIV